MTLDLFTLKANFFREWYKGLTPPTPSPRALLFENGLALMQLGLPPKGDYLGCLLDFRFLQNDCIK